jgi:hypothetical protein
VRPYFFPAGNRLVSWLRAVVFMAPYFVMAGLVPAIHAFNSKHSGRRGWPATRLGWVHDIALSRRARQHFVADQLR